MEMGLDAFDWHWRRPQADPHQGSNWFHVMQTATSTRIDQIVSLAESVLPLHEIAIGPADGLGLGKEFEARSCLDFLLQDLNRFPGKGQALILAGLRSPVVRNRNMALNALANWDPTSRIQKRDALVQARQEEVDARLRERIEGLLATE